MRISGVTGPVETSVRAAATRLAVISRVLVVTGCTVLLPLGATTPASYAVVAGVLAWQVVFVLTGRWPRARTAVDALLLAGVSVLLPWIDPPNGHLDLDDWARPVTSMCVGAAQIWTRPLGGAAYALAAAAGMWAGSAVTSSDDWNLRGPQVTMLFWQAAMARGLIVLVSRGARRVDDLTAATAATRREAELTAARRADVEEHLAVLHDTVAATLTAASSPGAAGPELRRRALSDLALLDPLPRADPATPLSRDDRAGSPSSDNATFADLTVPPEGSALSVAVEVESAEDIATIPAYAINALLAARDEALRNVERHAGTGTARVIVRWPAAGEVELHVIDEGRGFDPGDVPPGAHLGLRLSVEARMRRAGGSSRVVSAPGSGTRVELRWPAR